MFQFLNSLGFDFVEKSKPFFMEGLSRRIQPIVVVVPCIFGIPLII